MWQLPKTDGGGIPAESSREPEAECPGVLQAKAQGAGLLDL